MMIKEYLNLKDQEKINELVKMSHPYDIIESLKDLTDDDIELFYSLLDKEKAAQILAFLEPEDAAEVVNTFILDEQKEIIDNLDLDDAADIIVHLDEKDELLKIVENEELINKVLTYDDDFVGAHMTDGYIELQLGMDIKEATKKVISKANEVETLNDLFVVDEKGVFVGTIELRVLIKTKAPAIIDNLVTISPFVYDTDDVLEAVYKIENYGLYEMAVVNSLGVLMGVVSIDDAIEIYHDEVTEDFEKFALLPDTKTKGIFASAIKRMPWLVLLLVLSVPIALATSRFEEVIAATALLAIFQPLILDAGGDAASQTLAVTLFLLSKDPKSAVKNGKSEIAVGVINGVVLGFASAVVSFLIALVLNISRPFIISLVVGLSLSLTVMIGPVFALAIPIALKKLKFDPAIASGPFITTLIDVTSVVVYFGLATLLLGVL